MEVSLIVVSVICVLEFLAILMIIEGARQEIEELKSQNKFLRICNNELLFGNPENAIQEANHEQKRDTVQDQALHNNI